MTLESDQFSPVLLSPSSSLVSCANGANTVVAAAASYGIAFEIHNPPGNAAHILVNLGAAATATLGIDIPPGGYYSRRGCAASVNVWNLGGAAQNVVFVGWS